MPPAVVIQVAGSVDGLTADDLYAAITALLREGRTRLVADFTGVDYTSSAGLRVLLLALQDARRLGGDLRIAAVRPPVLRVLEMSGVTGITKIFAGTDAAVDSFAD